MQCAMPAQNKLGALEELEGSRPSVSSTAWSSGLTTQWFSVQAVTATRPLPHKVKAPQCVKNVTVTCESHRVEDRDAVLLSHVF